MTESGPDAISRARSIGSTGEARELYAEWAATYDDDVFGRAGVTGSRRVADLFAEHVADRTAAVVDLGCGTGAVGRRLRDVGFTDLTGLDLSPEMLSVAAAHGGAGGLVAADLHRPPIRDRSFDGSVSAGMFTTGHLGADAVPSVLALLRPGAHLVWSVAPAVWPEIAQVFGSRGLQIVSAELESIRADRVDRSHMVVAVVDR